MRRPLRPGIVRSEVTNLEISPHQPAMRTEIALVIIFLFHFSFSNF